MKCYIYLWMVLLFACKNTGKAYEKKGLDAALQVPGVIIKEEDIAFVQKVAEGCMMEVALGRLAETKANHQHVRQFGNLMVTDHEKASNELRILAIQKNIALPEQLTGERKRKFDTLRAKEGCEFDMDYLDFMIKDYEEDIRNYASHVSEGHDLDLRNWASSMIPTIENNLRHAKLINSILIKNL